MHCAKARITKRTQHEPLFGGSLDRVVRLVDVGLRTRPWADRLQPTLPTSQCEISRKRIFGDWASILISSARPRRRTSPQDAGRRQMSGLPTSIQIIGRHFKDDTVLKVGNALETVLGLRNQRPAVAGL